MDPIMRMTRSLAYDTALAVVLAGFGVVGTSFAQPPRGPELSVDAGGYALVAGAALALAVRRRWPPATLLLVAVLTAGYLAIGYPYGPIMLSFLVAVYTAARHRPLGASVPAAAAALGLLLVHLATNPAALPGLYGVIPISAWVVVPFALGVTVRLRQESIARQRAEAVRQRVDDERLRVAQEVHDVVGHGLVAIKMQADVALHVLRKRPEQAETALAAISRTSGEALDELRATLAVVRRAGTGTDPRSPAPGLARLEELRQRMGEAGVEVRLEITGEPRPLPAAVDLTGYRVVQESLTNVLRHSGASHATVTVAYGPDTVTVSVVNPVVRSGGGGSGLGIAGMRERVRALGGEFSAGPTDDGGFAVRAVLPTGGHR
jgi:signal transduction histidine kinase